MQPELMLYQEQTPLYSNCDSFKDLIALKISK